MRMKQYSRLVGWVFFLLAVFSLFTDRVLFGYIQFDPLQNWFRFGIGIFAIAISRPDIDVIYAKSFCYLTSISFLAIGVLSFVYPEWGTMQFEAIENLLHLFLGAWGLYMIWNDWKEKRRLSKESSSSSSPSHS